MVVSFAVAFVLQQRPVALSTHAMTLDAAMRELTAKTGEAYQAATRMGSRIVLSVGPPRPADAIRADLAAATWGAWRHSERGWTLDEDTEGVRARDSVRAGRRIASVQRSQAALAAKATKPFDTTAARALKSALAKADGTVGNDDKVYQRMAALQDGMPAMVALRRIILSFKPAELAALPDGRLVFSDRPTRLQRALPSEAGDALAGLVRDQNVWANATIPDDTFQERRNGVLTSDPRNYNDPIASGTVRVVLQTQVDRQNIRFVAWFVDKDLAVRQFAETEFNVTSAPSMSTAPVADPNDKPLPLGGEADAYAEALSGKGTAAMRAKLLAPERNEPLDFYPAEVCRAIARSRKKVVTIWLDDNLVAFAFDGYHHASMTRPNTASEWIRQLWIRAFNANERADAIVFRPRGAAANVDRRLMGDFVRTADAKGIVSLDDLADYAAASSTGEDSLPMLTSATLKGLVPGAEAGASGADWGLLRLWGAFTRPQRQAFQNGATVSLASLTQELRERFLAAIIGASDNELQKQEEPGGPGGLRLYDEPTELLANGFRTDGALGIVYSEVPGVLAKSEANDPDEAWSTGYANAWNLANGVVERERKHYDGLPQVLPAAYVPGTILDFGFSVALTRNLTWKRTSQYGEFDARAKPQPLSAMPDAFQKEFNGNLKELRKAQANP